MQLDRKKKVSPLREKLGKAALAAILLDVSAASAHADSGSTTQLDITTLLYGEQSRAQVVEPLVRVTRLYTDGQSLSAQFGLDVITGASPTGALPTGGIQTSTTPSGQIINSGPGEIPVKTFSDQRFGIDGDWQKPLNRYFTSEIGGHFSREKDYQSLGVNGKFSVEVMHRLLTLSAGGGFNHDSVSPIGGTPEGLSDGSIRSSGSNPKEVAGVVLGVSRILTRRWMVALDGSRTRESGYLTEPYKVISLVDPLTGIPVSQLTDKRPSLRDRTSLLFSSVYHLTDDVLYLSYRYYWDNWNVQSHTFDLKIRHELSSRQYLEPHIRYYHQGPASFFTIGLVDGAPIPDFATSDTRLGLLNTMTLGAAYGFHLRGSPGQWTVRAEYVRQSGNSFPEEAIGVQSKFNLFPPINIAAVVIGYSLDL